MFSGFFNYDNPVWRFIGKFGDLIILNILWLVCSIPVITIGASTTAVYYVTLKLARDDDGYTIRSFFKSFKENFKQSTVIWLILLAVGVILYQIVYRLRVLPDGDAYGIPGNGSYLCGCFYLYFPTSGQIFQFSKTYLFQCILHVPAPFIPYHWNDCH